MKKKLFGFAIALIAVATIGVVQLQANAAADDQVGGVPRCDAVAIGPRDDAFSVNGNVASVSFKVTGQAGCRVRLSANSFYAPSMNGRPFDQQILFQRVTKVFTPGTYTMSVALPSHSTEAKGCFYQTDLTYGTSNQRPVLAFGLGRLDCSQPKPVATCDNLAITKLSRTSFRLSASASARNGASIKSYTYQINGVNAFTGAAGTVTYNQSKPGTYTVKLIANTSIGPKTSAMCEKTLTVTPAPVTPQPGVAITKLVDGQKSEQVELNTPFNYQLKVTNTGNIDLKNVVVSDLAPANVTFMSAQVGTINKNSWTYTIPSLTKGQSMDFTIVAKVTSFSDGNVVNTACVNAPEVNSSMPSKADSCDTATVTVPKPGQVSVCNPATGQIITVDQSQAGNFLPVDSDQCQQMRVCDLQTQTVVTISKNNFDSSTFSTNLNDCAVSPSQSSTPTITPSALPQTGPSDILMKLAGAISLTTATVYYIASRRLV